MAHRPTRYRAARKRQLAMDELVYEKDLQETLRQAASLHKWLCYHTYDSRRSEAGFPDLILAGYGQLIAWELKRQGENPTDSQQRWLDTLAGVTAPPLVEVIRPSDLNRCLDVLNRKGK
jgi:hypothetical protein